MFETHQVTGPMAPGQYNPAQVSGPGAYTPMQTDMTGMFASMMPMIMMIVMLAILMPMVKGFGKA